jgi:hypothetical protein
VHTAFGGEHFLNKTVDELYEFVPHVYSYTTIDNINLILHRNFTESIQLCSFLTGQDCSEQGGDIDFILAEKLRNLKLKNIHGWLGASDEAQIFLLNPKKLLSVDMKNVEQIRESAWTYLMDQSVNRNKTWDKNSGAKYNNITFDHFCLDFRCHQDVANVPVIVHGKLQNYLNLWEHKYRPRNFPTNYIEGRISRKIKDRIIKLSKNSKKKLN